MSDNTDQEQFPKDAAPELPHVAPEPPLTAPVHRRQSLALLALALLVWGVDQLTKQWVVNNLPEGEAVAVWGEFLQWFFVRNPGAAFSFATGATWVFTVLAAVVVGAIVWQIRKLGSRSWALFFALLLGGVLGNLTDRLFREPGFGVGHVIDFISTPWMIPAIYNIADIAIVSAMVLFVLINILGLPMSGGPRVTSVQRARPSEDSEGQQEPELSSSPHSGEQQKGAG